MVSTRPLQLDIVSKLKQIYRNPTAFASRLTIMDKQSRMVKLKHSRIQLDFFSKYSYGKRPTDIILKPRRVGMTTGIVGELSRIAWTTPTRILTLMNQDSTTAVIRTMARRMYDYYPDTVTDGAIAIHKPRRKVSSATTTAYDNESEWNIATAGSKDGQRGFTVDVIHLSECAFYKDPDGVITGALQAADSARWKVWESTANGAQGLFYEMCMKAMDGDRDYKFHFYPWWWADENSLPIDPDYPVIPDGEETELIRLHGLTLEQINWRRTKQREAGTFFQQEYAESPYTCFLTSGGGFFGDTSKFFTAPTGATKQDGKRYVGGIDWGQSSDYTVFSIGCVDDGQMVYRYRVNRMEYTDMIDQIVNLVLAWGIDVIIPERNSMSMQVAALRSALEQRAPECQLQPFTTTNDSKRKGIMALHTALHSGALSLLPDPVARAEYNAFESTQTSTGAYTYQAAGDGHDDCIIADMLMWRAMNAAPIGVYFVNTK